VTNVHYFPRYSQAENFATNNTLLLFHRLYESNRYTFHKFLKQLVDDQQIAEIGLQLSQQTRTGQSVPDGYLSQDAIKICIEAKNSAKAFYEDQIRRHLDGFREGTSGYLILLSPHLPELEQQAWQGLSDIAKGKSVELIQLTFSKIIASFRASLRDFDSELQELVQDFEDYCSESGLIDTDATTLFVPPCGKSHEINVAQKLYFCPSTWSRRKTAFLGIYYDKAVRYIGRVAKVAYCERNGTLAATDAGGSELYLSEEEKQRVVAAMDSAMKQNGWDISHGNQFYLCNEMLETHFRKDTPGGIQGHRYFDLKDYGPTTDLMEVAKMLSQKPWPNSAS
jgi:hypothetical protein